MLQYAKSKIAFITTIILITVGVLWMRVNALDPVEELQQQINELSRLKDLSEQATAPLEAELRNIETKVKNIQYQLAEADKETKRLEADIGKREDDLAESYLYLTLRVRSFYKLTKQFSPLLTFLAAQNAAGLTRELSYRSAAADQDKEAIIETTKELTSLEADKTALEQRKVQLAALRSQFEKNQVFFSGEVKKAKAYQQELTGKIAALSARQKEILAAKSGTFQTTVGEVPLADDPASRPDYNPGFSPAFAAFSFGAPHFKGMSQYGAYGRAIAGQSYEQILKAYYGGGIEIKDHNPDAQITVSGYGSYSLEDYTKRIYEMPGSWGDNGGMEALKAQAVAARSYALARGGSICATEACQVFKPQPKGGKWEEAVDATRGKVVYTNGSPFSTWYASTSGGYQESYSANGYSTPGFWDTPSGRSGWTAEAWEKKAGSPWFYKGWYRDRGGDACGRSHPWLNSEEMADILNAWLILFEGKGDSSRVTPIGSCWGGDPYSLQEMRGIGGFTSVSGASVSYSENGVTAQVIFNTNKGNVAINGADFRKAFNLRAPGKISLKSGLYNIEKK